MRIGICDDEKEIQELIEEKVRKHCPEEEIVIFSSGEELLAAEPTPDLVFLDIRMDGKNGIETAAGLRRKKKKLLIIFITALEEYVFSAFDVGAFHYLVKPFSDEKFYEVLDRAREEYQESVKPCRNRTADKEDRYMIVKAKGIQTKVVLDTIIYGEVFNRKIVLHTTEGKLEYYGKMAELENRLGEDFFRIHRGYLVHFKYVKKYDAANVFLENGGQLIMSKRQFPKFVKGYLRYNKKGGREA